MTQLKSHFLKRKATVYEYGDTSLLLIGVIIGNNQHYKTSDEPQPLQDKRHTMMKFTAVYLEQ